MIDKRSEHKEHSHHNHRQEKVNAPTTKLEQKQHSHPKLNKQDHSHKEEITPKHKMH
ncbi:hypothetical protein [Photobacterium kishitanii]|uniref:hypothetical protein n=1 Tax=Photobacterium kishitanii TaxID=318456 RepID=UPI000430BF06|nr:hypothetical protein [Photobacterium kishitanii]CEO41709.1 hypothetical protein PPBDW_II1040 [Photobacterium kishitanii]